MLRWEHGAKPLHTCITRAGQHITHTGSVISPVIVHSRRYYFLFFNTIPLVYDRFPPLDAPHCEWMSTRTQTYRTQNKTHPHCCINTVPSIFSTCEVHNLWGARAPRMANNEPPLVAAIVRSSQNTHRRHVKHRTAPG